MKTLLRPFLDSLYKLLFGEDIFISYAREDGSKYAKALFVRLTKRDERLTCYMDELGTEPGKQVPPSLLRKVRNCSMLVLVGTPCAAASEGVRDEILEFLSVRRNRERIIPIDINQAIRPAIWAEKIAGVDLETELNVDALDGNVADSVVDRIERASGYRKQNDRLRLVRNWTLTVLGLLLLLSGFAAAFAYQRINIARDAENRARLAGENANAAMARAGQAETNANLSEVKAAAAETRAAAADNRRIEADRKAKEAEIKRDQAEKVGRQQEAIAEARRLINRSSELVSSNVEESLDYAAQSVRKVESNGLRLFEATQALRESLRIFPRQHEMRDAPNKAVLSPDAKYVAAEVTEMAPGLHVIGVFEARDLPDFTTTTSKSKPVHKYSFETDRLGFVSEFAISDEFSRAAVVQESLDHKSNFVVKDTRNQVLLDSSVMTFPIESMIIKSIALSPNGKYLAVVVDDPAKAEPQSGHLLPKTTESVFLVDVDTKKTAEIYSIQNLGLANLSFSENGKKLVAVGRATLGEAFAQFLKIGYVMIWSFADDGPAKLIDQPERVDPDFYPFEYLNNAAISNDGSLLAVTDPLDLVTVWEVDPLQVVARLPPLGLAQQLRFSSDSQMLITLSDGGLSTWDARGYTAQSQSAALNKDLAKRFETYGLELLPSLVDGVISSVTDGSTKQEFPLVPHLMMAPPLTKDAELEEKDQFNHDRMLDHFLWAVSENGKIFAALVEKPKGFAIQIYKRDGDRYIPHTLTPAGTAVLSRVFQEPSLPGMQRSENPYRQIAVSPNGKFVACNCNLGKSLVDEDSEHALCIWDVDHRRWLKKRVEKLSSQIRFKFSPNGKYVASFGNGQDLVLFNIQNQSQQRLSAPRITYFDNLYFDRDETLIGAIDTKGDVEVLSTRDLSRVTHLPLRRSIGEIAFSRDGKELLTHSYNDRPNSEKWEVWELDNDRVIKEACRTIKSYKFHEEPKFGKCE